MESTLDNFDTLCQQVFLPSKTANRDNADPAMTAVQETALSLLSRAQIYELQTPLPSTSTTPEGTQNDKQYYRIHLEELEDRQQQQKVRDILIQAIDPSLLVTLPYDRNLSGYSSKTRTEATEAPLESTVVLDMGGLSSPEPANESTLASSSLTTDSKTDIDDDTTSKTMLLVSVKEWLRLTGRIRFWRAESHRVKAAQREIVLNGLLEERWRTVASLASPSTLISSPPQSSGSPTAAAHTSKTLPSSAVSSPSTQSPSLTSSVPVSPPASVVSSALTKPSAYKQPFQEHQLESLIQFMATYGDEPSATSILRGLLDLTRRQLTDATVLSWTFDRANLTEQKPEVTVAFLDLVARLGLELVNLSALETAEQQQKDVTKRPAPAPTTSYSSTASDATVVGTSKSATPVQSTSLTWTFSARIDDHRLEYWIHHLQQNTLPVAKVDHQSLLPSTASFAPINNHSAMATGSTSSSGAEQRPNPIPLTIRKRFLQDRQTIPAGNIQPLINPHTSIDTNATTKGTNMIVRDSTFVLATSKYTLPSSSSSSSSQGLFMNVKKDVKDLARWASTCGGRLDWIWAWLFSSFQRSRCEAKSAHRKPRPNDENV
ncbi:hypothetical protein BGZ96_009425 [Linnemannia gamsii]|uniref:Uncharacterized protein n=1 Tax=Linnemannia gamsii TaxID=64522 RepID=A0ABQ7KD97_9FUNG|nr:hypothetical protein BGZ96_009425 [Linnemannia gamsii]